jgi:glycosyltransferase involved in cell wall biosynthesis
MTQHSEFRCGGEATSLVSGAGLSQPTQASSLDGCIAYLLKAFPRTSETFIASEIHRLEQAGVRIRIYVTKPVEEHDCYPRHPVVDRIQAPIECLPVTSSAKALPLRRWLVANLGLFLPALRRVALRRPVGTARAVAAMIVQTVRTSRAAGVGIKKSYIKDFLQAVALADRLLGDAEVRHLHAHYAHDATTIAWWAAMLTGLPFSFTAHARDIYSEALNPAGFLRRKMAAASFVVTCTDTNRQYLQGMAGRTPVHRVYHGMNADFARLLPQVGEAPRRDGVVLRIIGVGRLVPKKGFDVFIDACGILRRRQIPFEAVIIGSDGGQGRELREQVMVHGLDQRVRLLDPMSQAELYERFHQATVFCLPCRIADDGDRDGIPNVLVEAMACGLAVVTTGISGIPEVVADGVNGLLVAPNDPQVLADALLRLHGDPALAQRLGSAAQTTVRERFDGDVLAVELAALFKRVTS